MPISLRATILSEWPTRNWYTCIHVIPHYLSPNGSYKKLDINYSTLRSRETILPENLELTAAKTGVNQIKQYLLG